MSGTFAVRLFLVMVVTAAFPVVAQEPTCEIELAGTLDLLAAAQESAEAGDTGSAISSLERARENLDAILGRCLAVEATETAASLEELTRVKVLQTDDYVLDIYYPAGWVDDEVGEQTVVLASSRDVLDLDIFGEQPPPLEPGERLILIGVNTPETIGLGDLGENPHPAEILDVLARSVPESVGEAGEVSPLALGDQPAAELLVQGGNPALAFVVVQLPATGDVPYYAQIAALAGPDEIDQAAATARAIAEKLHFWEK